MSAPTRPMRSVIVLVALGLIGFGPLALFAPDAAATAFGIPAGTREAQAYILATAVRDVALGAGLLGVLGLGANRRILAASVAAIAFVAAGDAVNVIAHAGLGSGLSLGVHIGGLVVLLLVALWLWTGARE